MGILEYVIIGAAVGSIVGLIFHLIKSKKSRKKKTVAPKKEETKKVEEPKAEPDRSFKIAKKGRLSRVSKKALQTNARTATIEKVFERTPSMPSSTETDVYVEPLNPESQELLQTLTNVESSNRKVVSIGELKKQARQENMQDSSSVNNEEQYSSAKYISSGRAGEITGEYSGIHLGSSKRTINQTQQKTSKDSVVVDDDDDIDFEKLFNGGMFGSNNFESMERGPFVKEQPVTNNSDNIDFNDMVVAEAMLNPKYKLKQNKKNK